MSSINYYIILFVSFFFVASCEEDKIITPHKNETINKIILNCTSVDSSSSINLEYPLAEETIQPKLKSNTTYTTRLYTYNVQKDSVYDVTDEIIIEQAAHQFFYNSSTSNIMLEYKDFDSNGQPLGIETTLTTLLPSINEINIELIHQPIKSGKNVSINNKINAGGTTDFNYSIQFEIEQ